MRRPIEDCRGKSNYALSEILMAGIALFIFQQGSRNALNNKRQEGKFKKHYQKLFKLRLPHLDTVHRVLCGLADEQLERLKQGLMKTLLEKKVLHPYRLFKRGAGDDHPNRDPRWRKMPPVHSVGVPGPAVLKFACRDLATDPMW